MNPTARGTRPKLARTLLAGALAASVAVAVQNAKAQPLSQNGIDGRRFGVVYDVPATREVKLLASVPYWKDATHSLACDVYMPPRLKPGEKLPVVVFLNAIGDAPENSLKDWGIYRTWPRLIATQGMIGVSMQADSNAVECMRRLIAFLGSDRAPAGVDGQRIGVYAASANVTGANRLLFNTDAPKSIQAAVLYYGSPPPATDSLRVELPVLFVVAQGDAPRMGTPLDSLWTRVIRARAPWTLEFAAGMPHAFDAFADDDDSRRIIQKTIAFWRTHLLPVPQPGWGPSEEREILRAQFGNDLARAAELLPAWIEKHPNDNEALSTHARVLFELRRFPEAMVAVERAYRADSSNVPLAAQYGGALVQQRRFAEGARVIERALANGWSSSLAWGQLGYAHLQLGDNEAAVRHYEKAFEVGIPPGRTTRGVAAYNLACGYARLGRKDDALRSLDMSVNEGGGAGMAADTDFAWLKNEPRFQALAERVAARGR